MRPDPWLPRPAPGIPDGTILYDGVCVLCSRWVRFVAARDPERRFTFAPIQSPCGLEIAQILGIDPVTPETNAVSMGGTAFFKSDAALIVLGALGGTSSLAYARFVPRAWRNRAYDRIASNRYRLFGRTDACSLPSPALRDRVRRTRPS